MNYLYTGDIETVGDPLQYLEKSWLQKRITQICPPQKGARKSKVCKFSVSFKYTVEIQLLFGKTSAHFSEVKNIELEPDECFNVMLPEEQVKAGINSWIMESLVEARG